MWLSLNTQDDSVYSRPYRIIPRPVRTLKAQKKGILKFAKSQEKPHKMLTLNRELWPTLFPRRDKKGLRWTPLTTVPKKFHYFSNLKNVFKTWFRRPTNDLIELCFLWFYMCFCKKNHLNRYFETLYGLFSFWWPNRVIIWYFEPKKPKISVFWGIVCFVATFLQVLICKITRKTTWKNHKKGSTG